MNFRMFTRRVVAIRFTPVSCMSYFRILYKVLKNVVLFNLGTFYDIGGNMCQTPVAFMFDGWLGEWYNITFIPT